MPNPQQYTDAQLSDGTTLRFLGSLGPDEVRQKVQAFRQKQVSMNPPPLSSAPGGQFAGTAARGQASPQAAASMQTSALGALAPQPVPKGTNKTGQIPGSFEGSYLSGDTDYGAAMSGAGGLAGAALAAPYAASIPVLGPLLAKGAVKVAPYAKAAIGSALINEARKIPVVGKVIDKVPGAEMLPWLMAGSGEKIKGKEPTYPGAPEPSALPEQLNPSLSSESRTMPGQISKEVIRPKAQATAEPIPPRSGLALPPAPDTSPLPQALQPRTLPSEYGPAKTDFNGKVPNDSLGFDFSPAKDYGNAARADVEQKMGPTPRGNQLDDLLRNAVGNNPVKPGVAMRDQMKPSVPEGHTAVESKAMKSFKYDADAQELHVVNPSDGKTYIYGDVSPEQMQTFQNADSKGRALGAIRNSNPYVAYIPAGGSRIAVKPSAGRSATPQSKAPAPKSDDDMTSTLQKMLDQARAKKQ